MNLYQLQQQFTDESIKACISSQNDESGQVIPALDILVRRQAMLEGMAEAAEKILDAAKLSHERVEPFPANKDELILISAEPFCIRIIFEWDWSIPAHNEIPEVSL